jgi:hypothetical protein
MKPWSAGWRIAFDGRFLKGFEKNLQKTPSAEGTYENKSQEKIPLP